MINMENAHARFRQYLQEFDITNEKIALKIRHTYEVVRSAKLIAAGLRLSQEDQDLAELIALLHDIGRFEQVRRYDSFEPATMDHARYGVRLLFGSEQMIRQYVREPQWDDIIREAIARHSDYETGELADPRTTLHAKLIRDADKLDNCRVKLEEPIEVLLGMTGSEAGRQEITPKVWAACQSEKSILSSDRITRIDHWVSYIAYFFDINFPVTAQIILDEDYVNRVIHRIPYENKATARQMELLGRSVTDFLNRKASSSISLNR